MKVIRMTHSPYIMNPTLYIVLVAVFSALTTVGTVAVAIPFMGLGYLNFGDILVMTSGMVLGPIGGLIAGGLGSAMGDVILGYYHFAPITLVVKGLEGMIVGLFSRKSRQPNRLNGGDVIGLGLAAGVMLVGYFIAEFLLYGLSYAFAEMVTINLIQVGVGAVITAIVGPTLRGYLNLMSDSNTRLTEELHSESHTP